MFGMFGIFDVIKGTMFFVMGLTVGLAIGATGIYKIFQEVPSWILLIVFIIIFVGLLMFIFVFLPEKITKIRGKP